jgi:hypothetical protein
MAILGKAGRIPAVEVYSAMAEKEDGGVPLRSKHLLMELKGVADI